MGVHTVAKCRAQGHFTHASTFHAFSLVPAPFAVIAPAQISTADPFVARRAFTSHGVCIGVRTNEPALLDRVPTCFPPGWEESPGSRVDAWFSLLREPVGGGKRIRYGLYEDEEKLDEGFRLTRVLDRMDSAIRLRVGRRSPDRVFVHAGAVAWNNWAIVIPGRSGSGKTSLVAALVTAGATYYSDEYAVLDARGLLHPYTRALSFRQGEHRRLRRSAVGDLGGRHGTEPIPVGLVIQTRFRDGASWEPAVLSAGRGALALFANALAGEERPAFAFSVLARAAAGAVSLEGDRGAAQSAASAILAYASSIHSSGTGSRQ